MQEIQSSLHQTFGFLKKINQSEYVDEVEQVQKHVCVVVHLYQDFVPACTNLNKCLQQLAIKYPYTKFLKIISTDAQDSYDEVALPTLLIYQGGDLHSSFVRITQNLGNSFDVDHVEKLLQTYNALTTHK